MAFLEWKIRDFSGGLNDKVDDNLIADNEASDCQNVVATHIGSLTKRKGQAKLNTDDLGGPIQGLHAYYYGVDRKLVTTSNGVPYYWDGSAFQQITLPSEDYPDGLDVTASVYFETLVNYMVAFNGVNKPWKWDGTTASVLANAPADGQFCVLHKEKLFTVPKSDPSTLKWSDSFQPESWPEVNYWDIEKGDGDIITVLVPYLGELTIFKRYSIYSLRGTSLDDFRLDLIEPNIGAVGPRAVVFEGMYLYFVADDGIYVYNGAKTENLTRNKIPCLWSRVNNEHLHKAVAGRWDGLLWFAVPVDGSTYNNLVLVYNPKTSAWWPWSGINISCLQEFNDGKQLLLYAGSSVDGYILQQDVGYSDAGNAIVSYWDGKAFDIDAVEKRKKAGRAFIVDSPGANDVAVQLSFDYGAWTSLTVDRTEELVRRFKRPISSKWRYMKPRFYHDTVDQNFEVRGFVLQYRLGRAG